MKEYKDAREIAQKKANDSGMDFGLEFNSIFKTYNSFMLPRKENRTGHELRCEVVSPENIDKTEKGHGCK